MKIIIKKDGQIAAAGHRFLGDLEIVAENDCWETDGCSIIHARVGIHDHLIGREAWKVNADWPDAFMMRKIEVPKKLHKKRPLKSLKKVVSDTIDNTTHAGVQGEEWWDLVAERIVKNIGKAYRRRSK